MYLSLNVFTDTHAHNTLSADRIPTDRQWQDKEREGKKREERTTGGGEIIFEQLGVGGVGDEGGGMKARSGKAREEMSNKWDQERKQGEKKISKLFWRL